jgi:hypothetical protein
MIKVYSWISFLRNKRWNTPSSLLFIKHHGLFVPFIGDIFTPNPTFLLTLLTRKSWFTSSHTSPNPRVFFPHTFEGTFEGTLLQGTCYSILGSFILLSGVVLKHVKTKYERLIESYERSKVFKCFVSLIIKWNIWWLHTAAVLEQTTCTTSSFVLTHLGFSNMSTLCFSQIGVHSVTVTIFAMRFKLMNPTKVVFARSRWLTIFAPGASGANRHSLCVWSYNAI